MLKERRIFGISRIRDEFMSNVDNRDHFSVECEQVGMGVESMRTIDFSTNK